MLTDADLGIEILDKAGRANAFPLGDPWEDSFVPDHHIDVLVDAVDGLQPGDRILVDPIAIETFRDYRREPDRDPLTDPFGEDAIVPTGIAVLQECLLERIGTDSTSARSAGRRATGFRTLSSSCLAGDGIWELLRMKSTFGIRPIGIRA